MESKIWNIREISTLIEVYQRETVLYNCKDELYYNKSARREALERIIVEMAEIRPGITEAEIKGKWNSLRTQFCKEVQALRSTPSGSVGTRAKPRLWCFDKLLFLLDFIKGRRRVSNVADTSSQDSVMSIEESNNATELVAEVAPNSEQEENSVVFQISQNHGSTNIPRTTNLPTTSRSTRNKRKRYREEKAADTGAHEILESIRNSINAINCAETNLPATQMFGNFITSELQQFKNPRLQKRCRKELLQVLMHYQDLDDEEEQ